MAKHVSNNINTKISIKAWQHIETSSHITLLTHLKPDGDGISACAAFDTVLRSMGKTVETVYPSQPPMELKFHADNCFIAQHTYTPQLLIALDTANQERLYFPEEYKDIPLINIDHHISNSIDGTYNFIDPHAASACEVLYELLKVWCPERITQQVSERLLYGILYDTQTFHTQNTSAQTLRIAADLIDSGANLFALKTDLLSHKNPLIIKLWADVLTRIVITKNNKAAVSKITSDDLAKYDLTPNSLGGFVNFMAEIAGIDVVALLYEAHPEQIKISLRSKHADVNAIAQKFNGGGHIHASGAMVEGSLDSTMQALTKELESL